MRYGLYIFLTFIFVGRAFADVWLGGDVASEYWQDVEATVENNRPAYICPIESEVSAPERVRSLRFSDIRVSLEPAIAYQARFSGGGGVLSLILAQPSAVESQFRILESECNGFTQFAVEYTCHPDWNCAVYSLESGREDYENAMLSMDFFGERLGLIGVTAGAPLEISRGYFFVSSRVAAEELVSALRAHYSR